MVPTREEVRALPVSAPSTALLTDYLYRWTTPQLSSENEASTQTMRWMKAWLHPLLRLLLLIHRCLTYCGIWFGDRLYNIARDIIEASKGASSSSGRGTDYCRSKIAGVSLPKLCIRYVVVPYGDRYTGSKRPKRPGEFQRGKSLPCEHPDRKNVGPTVSKNNIWTSLALKCTPLR